VREERAGQRAIDPGREMAEFSAFYREQVPRLVTFLICQGATLADAADCVQDTLIEALPPAWGTLTNPYPWCRTVAYRKLCALWQRRVPPVEDPELAGSPLIAPNRDLDLFEQGQDFLYWLDQLRGDRQRAVLVCTYDGASTEEIAELLEMAPANVRSTLRNARVWLRRSRAQRTLGGDGHDR
jgi:RNA polymerase sigma factor (sigma-70 family)